MVGHGFALASDGAVLSALRRLMLAIESTRLADDAGDDWCRARDLSVVEDVLSCAVVAAS